LAANGGMGGESDTSRPGRPVGGWDRDLTFLESAMLSGAEAGRLVDGGEGPFDLPNMQAWGPERTIRASVLRHLLVSEEWRVDARGIQLRGVRIAGQLDLEGATLRCPLFLDKCYFATDVPVLVSQATAMDVTLTGCLLAGLNGGQFVAKALDLSRSTVTGALWLPDAVIDGPFSCRGAQLSSHDGGKAVAADGIRVGGDVLLDEVSSASGAVLLRGADIGGQLSCHGARLSGHDGGEAVAAQGIRAGAVFLDEVVFESGGVSLRNANIGGQLSCHGAQLSGHDHDGKALAADQVLIGGDVLLDAGFSSSGEVSLSLAQIEGSVSLVRARLASDATAFDSAGARIKGALLWVPEEQVHGLVDLENAEVGELDDDWGSGDRSVNGFWPPASQLRLRGFTYGAIGGVQPSAVSHRLDWIRSQFWPYDRTMRYTTLPYDHLAAAYRKAGLDTQATQVAIAMRSDRRRFDHLGPPRWFVNWLWDKTIKYGYQNWRAIWYMVAIYAIVAIVLFIAQGHGLIVPVGSINDLHPVPVATRCHANYPCFYPAGYALDVVLPLINVHQAQFWGVNGVAPWGRALISFTWVATALGWVGASFLLAGLTSLVRRN